MNPATISVIGNPIDPATRQKRIMAKPVVRSAAGMITTLKMDICAQVGPLRTPVNRARRKSTAKVIVADRTRTPFKCNVGIQYVSVSVLMIFETPCCFRAPIPSGLRSVLFCHTICYQMPAADAPPGLAITAIMFPSTTALSADILPDFARAPPIIEGYLTKRKIEGVKPSV
jgi:hypothetical protein